MKVKYIKPKFKISKVLPAIFEAYIWRHINNKVGMFNRYLTKEVLHTCRRGCEECYAICGFRSRLKPKKLDK